MSSITFPIETEALVVGAAGAGFKRQPVTITGMRADEVLVEMLYTGICHTVSCYTELPQIDAITWFNCQNWILPLYTHKILQDIVGEAGMFPQSVYPMIFGHEGGGIVRAIGSEVGYPELAIGDAVICCYKYCQECKPCKAGRPAACARHGDMNVAGVRKDGTTPYLLADGQPVRFQFYGQSSFARMAVVAAVSVVRCPYPGSLEIYSAMGCGFQTGAGTILNALQPPVDKSLAIFGIGGVGMTAIMGAKILGLKKIVAVDMVPEKLEMAKKLGATDVVNTKETPDIAKTVQEATNGGADYIVECTGVPVLLEALVDSTAAEGICATLGVPPKGYKLPVNTLDILLDNKTLRGIVQGESLSRNVGPPQL